MGAAVPPRSAAAKDVFLHYSSCPAGWRGFLPVPGGQSPRTVGPERLRLHQSVTAPGRDCKENVVIFRKEAIGGIESEGAPLIGIVANELPGRRPHGEAARPACPRFPKGPS